MFSYRIENQMKNFSSVLIWFILVRLISAFLNPIDDCDEVYNFYEPVSFIDVEKKETLIYQYIWRTNGKFFDFSYTN